MPDTHGFSDDFLAGMACACAAQYTDDLAQHITLIAQAKTHHDAVSKNPEHPRYDWEYCILDFNIMMSEINHRPKEPTH
jgi:hypothetical protein